MIDKTFLPATYSETDKVGHYVEFYPSGQIKHIAFYRNGSCADFWQLNLEEGVEEGKAVLENGSGANGDWETYRNGTSELFDAWSDNTKPQTTPFEAWVKNWIERIFQYH